MAEAPPPPLHIPAAPIVLLFFFNVFKSVTRIRAPEQPRGCPNETAPPLTLTFSISIPNFLILAIPTTEKASLSSQKSTESLFKFALFRAFSNALVGVVVNHFGS